MALTEVKEGVVERFIEIVGEKNVLLSAEQKSDYSHDKTEDYFFMPDIVVKPGTPVEVSQILSYCNTHKIPVTPRGAGKKRSSCIHGAFQQNSGDR